VTNTLRQQRGARRATVFIALVGLLLAACGSGSKSASAPTSAPTSASTGASTVSCASPTSIPIGASVSETGGAADIGQVWAKGIQLAVDIANKNGIIVAGKCYNFSLSEQDDATSPEVAIGIYQKFLQNGDKYILGPGVGTVFTAAYASAKGDSVLIMTPTSIGSVTTGYNPLLFQTHITDAGTGGRVYAMAGALAAKYKPTSVALLESQDPLGELHEQGLTAGFKNANVPVVYAQYFPAGTTDFAPYIAAIKSKNPSLVIIGYLDTYVHPFLQQAVQAGFTSPVFVGAPGSTFASIQGITGISNYAVSITTRAVDNASDPQVAAFRAAWTAQFGSEPNSGDFWALSYFDDVLMLSKAMSVAGSIDPTAVATALHSTASESYPDRTLNLSFGSNNIAQYTPQMGYWLNGQITYVNLPLG
jgi:branched-chain amino acid transport system substrate-binding protein